MTDLCEYCEKEIFYRKKIAKVIVDEKYEIRESYDIKDLRKHFYEKALELKANIERTLDEDTLKTQRERLKHYKEFTEELQDYEVI